MTIRPDLYSRSEQVTPGGVHTANRYMEQKPVFVRGQGARIWDSNGKEYLDYQAAFGPFILGHCFPEVVNAVTEAIQHTDLYGVGTTDLEVQLSEKICQVVPSAEQVLFCNAGAEATYHAIRLSRAVTGRRKIIKFQGCYHGWHDYVCRNMLSTPDKIMQKDPGSAGILEEVLEATLVCQFNDLEGVAQTVRENKGDVACIILEPIPHNIGCVMPRPGFLEGLRELTRENGIILIFDEVITGWRHHIGGYQSVAGVIPDLTTMGKAMANGFPIAALAGRRDLMQFFNTRPGGNVFFAGTYNGHAVGTAAALATIKVLETQGVYEHIFRLGEKMRQGLRAITGRLGLRATVAGYGSVFVTYFMDGKIENYSDLMNNDVRMFAEYRTRLLERGIFKIPTNLKRAHISFSHTDADIEYTLQVMEDVLTDIVRGR